MRKHARTPFTRTRVAVGVAVAAAVVAGGAGVTARATSGATGTPATATSTPTATPPVSLAAAQTPAAATHQTTPAAKTPAQKPAAKKSAKKFPAGTATATSFWDPETASGKPMRYQTIASPYWPLGTKVKVTYGGESRIGYVEDFGPAEWAVAQHDIPAILDLSEEMMADLTGTRSNSVHVKFEVLQWGSGRVYRHSGTGYSLAMGK